MKILKYFFTGAIFGASTLNPIGIIIGGIIGLLFFLIKRNK